MTLAREAGGTGYGPTTRFTSNTGSRLEGLIPDAYAPYAQRIFASYGQKDAVTTESDVAEAVWRAANDATGQLRFPAGAEAVALAQSSQTAVAPGSEHRRCRRRSRVVTRTWAFSAM